MEEVQALLAAINFSGSGAYGKKMSAAQRNQANSLATRSTDYNNNLVCYSHAVVDGKRPDRNAAITGGTNP